MYGNFIHTVNNTLTPTQVFVVTNISVHIANQIQLKLSQNLINATNAH